MNQTTREPLSKVRVVVDATLPDDEVRVHPAMFMKIKSAFLEADMYRHLEDML